MRHRAFRVARGSIEVSRSEDSGALLLPDLEGLDFLNSDFADVAALAFRSDFSGVVRGIAGTQDGDAIPAEGTLVAHENNFGWHNCKWRES